MSIGTKMDFDEAWANFEREVFKALYIESIVQWITKKLTVIGNWNHGKKE
jgi:hypothetical protein